MVTRTNIEYVKHLSPKKQKPNHASHEVILPHCPQRLKRFLIRRWDLPIQLVQEVERAQVSADEDRSRIDW